MPFRRVTALVLIAVATLAGCGSSDDSGTAEPATVDGDVVAVGEAPTPPTAPTPAEGVGDLADAVEVAAGAPGEASDVTCTVDRQTLESAVETYELLNGALPTTQQELLDAQFIRELSVHYDVTAEGAVVPAAGSSCP